MFAVFTYLNYHSSQKKTKQNMTMKTYEELHSTCIKSEKTVYINTVCTKSARKDSPECFAIFGSSACQSQHSFLTYTAPRSSYTNVQELI